MKVNEDTDTLMAIQLTAYVNRLKTETLIELLIDKGLFTKDEYERKFNQISSEKKVKFMKDILGDDVVDVDLTQMKKFF